MIKKSFDINFIGLKVINEAAKFLDGFFYQRVVTLGVPHDGKFKGVGQGDAVCLRDNFYQVLCEELGFIFTYHICWVPYRMNLKKIDINYIHCISGFKFTQKVYFTKQ